MATLSAAEAPAPRHLLRGCLLVVAVPLLVWFSLWLLLPSPLLHTWPVGPADPLPVSADGQFYGIERGRIEVKHIGTDDLAGYSSLELRHVGDGAEVGTFGTWGAVNLAISPDGQLLATGSVDETVQVWRVRDGALLQTMQQTTFFSPDQMKGLAFSPDSQWLASGGDDGTVNLWRVSDGARLHTFHEQGRVSRVAFSPDSRFLAYSLITQPTVAIIRRVDDGTLLRRLLIAKYNTATSVAFSPDGQFLAVGVQADTGGQVHVWRAFSSEAQPAHTFSTRDWIFAVAFSPDGQFLAAGGGVSGTDFDFIGINRFWPQRKPITIWRFGDTWSDWPVQTIASPHGYIKDLAFTPDSQQLVASGGYVQGGGAVALFQVSPGRARWNWLVPASAVAALSGVVWHWRRERRTSS